MEHEHFNNVSMPCLMCGDIVNMYIPATSAMPTVAYCPKHLPDKATNVLGEVLREYRAASYKFPPFNSAHEGFAVLDEERDELWEEVKGNKRDGAYNRMRAEAIQVAAMAIRFVIDVCGEGQ